MFLPLLARLVAQYGGLDTLYMYLRDIDRPSLRQALIDGRDDAYLFKRLATLINDLPLSQRNEP